jgi:hypothetical protein
LWQQTGPRLRSEDRRGFRDPVRRWLRDLHPLPGSTGAPVSLRETVELFEKELPALNPAILQPIPTGFPQLDLNTGGGLHAEDLILVVGKQNVGKTLFVSQLGRNIARWAARLQWVVCLLVCYEHSPSCSCSVYVYGSWQQVMKREG